MDVSEIGLGALEIGRPWPNWRKGKVDFDRPSDAEAIRLVGTAIDAGINFIDTAPAYVESERLLGMALKGKRESVVLATKCGEWFDSSGSRYDYSGPEVKRFMESSLRALRTDRVDLLQIHSASAEVIRRGETAAAMKRLQEEGKARFLGVSVDSEEAAIAAIESGHFDCLQLSYNLLTRRMGDRAIPLAKERGMGVIVKDGLSAGRLGTNWTDISDEQIRSRVAAVAARAERAGIRMPEYAIRFVLSHPDVSTLIVGTKRVEHLLANIRATLDPEMTRRVAEAEWGKGE